MGNARLMIAGVSSGSGKTMITCGLLNAFKRRNLHTVSFKCGPDYIDPMFHREVIGTPSRNLDSFFTGDELTKYLFCKSAKDAELSILEGVMGFYDGIGGTTEHGSSWEVASITKTPVILVVNCKGMSYSILAIIKGFISFFSESGIKGVILNHISASLYEQLKPVIENKLKINVYGYVPFIKDCGFESRHLGLVTPAELIDIKQKINQITDILEQTLDIDALLKTGDEVQELTYHKPDIENLIRINNNSKPIIAAAMDRAFCFYYEDNLDLLRELGAEIIPFSPLYDKELPKGISGLLLGGGYPELYTQVLSENSSMRESIYEELKKGLPFIAECGGYLYLCSSLEDEKQKPYPMVGFFPWEGIKKNKLERFGYITLTAKQDHILCRTGEQIRGHEFHYWDSTDNGDGYLASKPITKRQWNGGHVSDTYYAGFPHLYFYSNPRFPVNFINACIAYSTKTP